MLSLIRIWNAGLSTSIIVNELTGVLKYPVRRFEWPQSTRGDDLPKMEEAGSHDRYKRVEPMPITMEGDFLGIDTDDYWINRKALLDIIVPDPVAIYRRNSRIEIKIDGDSETYWADVDLEDYDAPLEALYPTRTPFLIHWTNNFGYWRKLSNNAAVKI